MEDELSLELSRILETMDVPPARKEDLGWLMRNLAVRNGEHPDFDTAKRLISQLAKLKKVK